MLKSKKKKEKHKIYICFGGNIGDVIASIEEAILLLSRIDGLELLVQSSYWYTEPQGNKEQPWFVNAVASFSAMGIDPHVLLEKTKEIEYSLGRKRVEGDRNAARTLDIDILDFAGMRLESEELILPHARMFERAFVLVPLCEISPEYSYNSKDIRHYLESIEYRIEGNKIFQ